MSADPTNQDPVDFDIAYNALADVLQAGGLDLDDTGLTWLEAWLRAEGFDLDDTGLTWLEAWLRAEGFRGDLRLDLFARPSGSNDLRDLCGKIRENKSWLVALAEMERQASGSDQEPAATAAVLDNFDEVLSEAGTPFCTKKKS